MKMMTCATCKTEHEKGERCPNQPDNYVPRKVREAMRIVYEWAKNK
jgi:hypothetical protein